MSAKSELAAMIKSAELIIWAECTMTNKSALQAVNTLLQDLCDNRRLFGGKTVVLSGDFRQTLPVVTRGTKADVLRVFLKSSPLWKRIQVLQLHENMRCLNFGRAGARFARQLLDIGCNKEKSGTVDLRDVCCHRDPEEEY